MAPNTSQAGGSFSGGTLWPAKPRAADEPTVDAHRVGPVERDGPLGWCVHRQRVGERDDAGIERATRGFQRLLGLQHDGEFGEIEAAHIDQRAGSGLRRDAGGMSKGVADFAQGDEPEWRRQIERGFDDLRRRVRSSSGMWAPGLAIAACNDYNLL